jgi:hypothetical protein
LKSLPLDISKGWLPDLLPEDIAAAGGLVKASNVIPVAGNYLPVLDKAQYTTNAAMSGTPLQGLYCQTQADGTYYNFVGTTTKIYRFSSKTSVTDATKTAATYTATFWSFVVYGDWLIATDYEYAPQILKGINVDLAVTKFVDLGGIPAGFGAKYMIMNHGHLIAAYYKTTADGVLPKGIRWSGREAPESWTASLTTGADEQLFPEMLGIITGIKNVGDSFGVFAEDSITLGYYIGGQYTFGFKQNAIHGIGCYYPGSLISIGNLVFFWSKKSAWMWDGAGYPTEIGVNLKKSVISQVNSSYSDAISVCHDRDNSLIMWLYPDQSSTGNPNKMVVYNYAENRWAGPISMTGRCIFSGATGGFPADSWTGLQADDIQIKADSAYWLGKEIQPLLVGTDGYANTFSGSPLTCELETGEVHQNDVVFMAKKAFIPVDGLLGAGSVKVKHRYSMIDGQAESSASSIKSDGTADLRTSNRRLALNVQAQNFTRIGKTLTIEGEQVGRR